jgi:hypothetical protein
MSSNKGSYCPQCGTWGTKCGTLNGNNWSPYCGEPWFPSKEHYSVANRSWTVGNNVTQSIIGTGYSKWKSKEGYCASCKPTPYLRSNQTWKGQKPYQS